jgi:hypothetical protein
LSWPSSAAFQMAAGKSLLGPGGGHLGMVPRNGCKGVQREALHYLCEQVGPTNALISCVNSPIGWAGAPILWWEVRSAWLCGPPWWLL